MLTYSSFMPGKTHTAPTVLEDEPARLAAFLKRRIDAFADKPMDIHQIGQEAREIADLARSGTVILNMHGALERTRRQADKMRRKLGADEFDTDEGDVMETDERSAMRSDPEYVERLCENLAARFTELGDRLESQGLLDRVLAIDCPPSRADLVQRAQPQAAAA